MKQESGGKTGGCGRVLLFGGLGLVAIGVVVIAAIAWNFDRIKNAVSDLEDDLVQLNHLASTLQSEFGGSVRAELSTTNPLGEDNTTTLILHLTDVPDLDHKDLEPLAREVATRARDAYASIEDVDRVQASFTSTMGTGPVKLSRSRAFTFNLCELASTPAVDGRSFVIPPVPDGDFAGSHSDESLRAGNAVFGRMVRALGGADAESVRAVRYTAAGPQGTITTMTYSLPDKLSASFASSAGTYVMVVDGEDVREYINGQRTNEPDESLADLAKTELVMLVYAQRDPDLEASLVGDAEVAGEECQLVAVTHQGSTARLCIADDGRVLRKSYLDLDTATGLSEHYVSFPTDYREIDGRLVPHLWYHYVDGAFDHVERVTSWEFNPEIDPSVFEAPVS